MVGSPPLARERLVDWGDNAVTGRITPACAGKTVRLLPHPCRIQDHPRLRGKDAHGLSKRIFVRGSPPLARERPFRCLQMYSMSRITPACAGKTLAQNAFQSQQWDHPRLRGKDATHKTLTSQCRGSPPLARERQRVP